MANVDYVTRDELRAELVGLKVELIKWGVGIWGGARERERHAGRSGAAIPRGMMISDSRGQEPKLADEGSRVDQDAPTGWLGPGKNTRQSPAVYASSQAWNGNGGRQGGR